MPREDIEVTFLGEQYNSARRACLAVREKLDEAKAEAIEARWKADQADKEAERLAALEKELSCQALLLHRTFSEALERRKI